METVLPNGDVLRIEAALVDVSLALDGPFPKTVPGRVSYFLNERPISPEEYERLLESAR